jgi:hypothetical protein
VSIYVYVRRKALHTVALLVFMFAAVVAASSVVQCESLPFDRSNPFIWDNDAETDAFSLALVLALANNGDLNLIGISQSPHPFKPASEDFQSIVAAARASGWRNLPDATWNLGGYYMTALAKPASGRVDDTAPLITDPAEMIRDRVLAVGTASKPVVIGTGGALTTVASAYLLALQEGRGAEFAQKSIVAASIGIVGLTPLGLEYNAAQDEWALNVVLDRLRVVLAPLDMAMSVGDQQRIWNLIDALPNNAMGAALRHVNATYPYDKFAGVVTGDMQPIIAMLYPQEGAYFHGTRRVRVNSWIAWPSNYPDHGPWDPAHPERPALNWNALKQVLTITDDDAASTVLLEQYDLVTVANTVIESLQTAFASR